MLLLILMSLHASAESQVRTIASVNGFKPSERTVKAIEHAASVYNLDTKDLTAIAIIETGLGSNIKVNRNKNGTIDSGLFQVNSINQAKCAQYNLSSHEGSALCAAKLLNELRKTRSDYVSAYHSKTPSIKEIYRKKIKNILDKTKKRYYANIEQ